MVEEREVNLIEWQPSDMLEVTLNEPDDFLKVKDEKVNDKIEDKNEENDTNYEKEETIPAKRNIEDVRKARLAYFDKKFKK